MNRVTDILLINPPREFPQHADFPPIGLAYISAYLRKNGINSSVLDASSYSWERLRQEVAASAPRIAGIPCWTIERGQSFKTANLVKELLPETPVIMGGHHATAFPAHMFIRADATAVVMGEGEVTTLELVRALLDGDALEGIKGIAYAKDGEVRINEPRELVEDLDSLPFPDYSGFDLDEYPGLPESTGRSAAVITSRGCPHRCVYCSGSVFWRRKWRARSAKNVLDEIEVLYKDLGVRHLLFFDDNFTVNKERAINICKGIIELKMDIKWVAESHVSHIDDELLGWMKKSGCYRIDYGVESGSPRILKNIKKGQTVALIKKTFALTHEAGIKPRAYLMVGNPGEDETTVRETAELIRDIKPYMPNNALSAGILWILPETENYETAKANGIISDDFWIHEDSMLYYTAEHSVEELEVLRADLIMKLALNRRDFKTYLWYLLKKLRNSLPGLQ